MRLRIAGAWAVTAALLFTAAPAAAGQYYRDDRRVRREIREGIREIERERREMRRDILGADTPWERERAIREGIREIEREKREMRREVRREIRNRW